MFTELMPIGSGGGEGEVKEVSKNDIPQSTGNTLKITLGYKPKKIAWWTVGATYEVQYVYDEDLGTGCWGNQYSVSVRNSLGTYYSNQLVSIDNDGFTLAGANTATYWGNIRYIASKN